MDITSSKNLLPKDGGLYYYPNLFNEYDIGNLISELDLRSEEIRLYGKTFLVPRLITYQGDRPYTYSGVVHAPSDFTPFTLELKQKAELYSTFLFNAVLVNYYRNGDDSMGYHADNEPEIDPYIIASLSFGAERKMKFKHKKDNTIVDITLEHGSLLIMKNCQEYWNHSIPKSKKVSSPRMNYTFRRMY